MRKSVYTIIITLMTALAAYAAAPVILTGEDLPHLVGKPIAALRVLDMAGRAIPFQVDEVTESGEYVLDSGEIPNANEGTGVFGEKDEIVFLWDDADSHQRGGNSGAGGLVTLTRGSSTRAVIIRADPSIPLSPKRYIEYDHTAHRVVTPYYYADFAPNRFHFLRAGVRNFDTGRYIDLTNELRVEILLRTLFGLIPVRYTEDNIVCFVRRYKVGPVRLIRRGDFHLNLGLGVRGSRAAVNQICYSQIVQVPVYISIPVRFRTLFSQAHIEMTPIIRETGRGFYFSVPSENIRYSIGGDRIDTLHSANPAGKMFTLQNGNMGYGWLLRTTMNPAHLSGSGFLMRRPPTAGRAGTAECGFRLAVRDVPKGNYHITNWVVFSGGHAGDVGRLGRVIDLPVRVGGG
ncbi:MAG: hypothetical protein LBC70_03710 [Chitinispirillales bacterium]|jgi:hypothetical protein|nr:hypothetical protein [Chitinispirillales bacterium]